MVILVFCFGAFGSPPFIVLIFFSGPPSYDLFNLEKIVMTPPPSETKLIYYSINVNISFNQTNIIVFNVIMSFNQTINPQHKTTALQLPMHYYRAGHPAAHSEL